MKGQNVLCTATHFHFKMVKKDQNGGYDWIESKYLVPTSPGGLASDQKKEEEKNNRGRIEWWATHTERKHDSPL